MHRCKNRALGGLIRTAIVCYLVAAPAPLSGGKTGSSLPKFSEVEQAVRAHFKSLSDYEAGDVITRRQVEPLLNRPELSWLGNQRSAILNQLLCDSDLLATELRTTAGRRFLKQIAGYPNGLDRLDRLGRLPQGTKKVRNLVHVRDGYKLIEYMTTKPGGAALGEVLSKSRQGVDFNQPTGRIYTEEMLVTRLRECYQKCVANRPSGPK